MAITVKTIKKKALVLKKPDDAAGGDGQAALDENGQVSAEAQAAGVQADVPAQLSQRVAVKRASYVFAGICAILIFLMFVTILILQWLEWDWYHNVGKNAFPNVFAPAGSSMSPGITRPTVSEPVPEEPEPAPEEATESAAE